MSQNKHPGGRPKIKIDYDEVYRMALIHCTQAEIATIINVSLGRVTGDKEFIDTYKKGMAHGKDTLRRLQYEKAEGKPAEYLRDKDGKVLLNEKNRPTILRPGYAPDTTMQIWLGKQLLEQRDQVELGVKDSPFAIAVVIKDSRKGKPFKEVSATK